MCFFVSFIFKLEKNFRIFPEIFAIWDKKSIEPKCVPYFLYAILIYLHKKQLITLDDSGVYFICLLAGLLALVTICFRVYIITMTGGYGLCYQNEKLIENSSQN